ncbi:MAG: hypothetical protein US86_C0002G0091 [Candidatus Daviesbacteria bacterium GW2011_GWA2_38_24]|uniref:Aminoglycoside phosphotransferase domain-containing protein n=1 Tax=Candidatus Daviesbacteria bacterium GW2011_GWA2_38_24 TaxID=1618422 RepID=A0A0G0LZY0_9BACT|nr:MAG: hypothetical protein US86_C0002G0091 [Candidatus Daviesbacteria bacterium GW2011_GWA2_38_24]OGE22981.1 MAG: hypothetical protein A2688_03255 [Candidatus Daviesbacteria bacterium RIFCSPHIGHO2_01_FULL_38_8]
MAISEIEFGRRLIQVGQHTLETVRHGRPSVFVKAPTAPWSENPHFQARAYRDLGGYLRVPRWKLLGQYGISTRLLTHDQSLIVQRVRGIRYDDAVLSSPEEFTQSVQRFTQDLSRLWQETKSRVDTNKVYGKDIKDQHRKEPLDTISAFVSDPETQPVLSLPLQINGVFYPSLEVMCQLCSRKLSEAYDPVVTVGHGDEHFGNLFVEDVEGETTYKIIDPKRKMFYKSPATTVNTFLGGFLLFVFDYASSLATKNNGVNIDYQVAPQYRDGMRRVLACTQEMVQSLYNLGEGEFLTKEYLFANLIRSYIGRVAPKNQEKIKPNTAAHLAMAVEAYYDFEGFLEGKYLG